MVVPGTRAFKGGVPRKEEGGKQKGLPSTFLLPPLTFLQRQEAVEEDGRRKEEEGGKRKEEG